MTSAVWHPARTSVLAPLVDEQRLGSGRSQLAVGIAGLVLAVLLVVGQITLVMTKGIATHLHNTVVHMEEGNEVMLSVIERAEPTVQLESQLATQRRLLTTTQQSLVATNEQLDAIGVTRRSLLDVVGRMRATSAGLASGVATVSTSTSGIASDLAGLPSATARTHEHLRRISTDTGAINGEVEAIGGKLDRYGLPQAKGVRTG